MNDNISKQVKEIDDALNRTTMQVAMRDLINNNGIPNEPFIHLVGIKRSYESYYWRY